MAETLVFSQRTSEQQVLVVVTRMSCDEKESIPRVESASFRAEQNQLGREEVRGT